MPCTAMQQQQLHLGCAWLHVPALLSFNVFGCHQLQVPAGDSAEAGLAGAINGLGAKVGGLEALLTLAQQRLADKADSTDIDSLR